jgi:hypothetical protein
MKTFALSVAAASFVIGISQSLAATKPPPPPPAPPAVKADLFLVVYAGLYQGSAPIGSSGGISMTLIGADYKSYDDCVKAQSKVQMSFVKKGPNNSGATPGDVLNWGALCVERQP